LARDIIATMPEDAISALLSASPPPPECGDVAAWWPTWRAISEKTRDPFERAVLGGAQADRLGWAFASGYQAALRALDPTLKDDTIAALCVTEAEGNFPRAIRTTLTPQGDGFLVSGEKRWTTLGPGGGLFIVIAREAGTDEARPSLKAVRVASGAPGLEIESMPPTSFVPEVPHARIKLDRVRVSNEAVAPGDAYSGIVKPFRTIEDIHVHAATIAYLMAEARRRSWPHDWSERAAMLLHSMAHLSKLDPLASETHIALSGALGIGEALVAEADAQWAGAGEEGAAARWARDRKLMGVASKARAQRLAAAWDRLGRSKRE
jgi:acyl-CoA dehydrogenase